MEQNLYEKILIAYPELTSDDFGIGKKILLQDDSDGLGAFIAAWNYEKPIPQNLKLGK